MLLPGDRPRSGSSSLSGAVSSADVAEVVAARRRLLWAEEVGVGVGGG